MQIHTTGKKAGSVTLNQSERNTLEKACVILRTIQEHVPVDTHAAALTIDRVLLDERDIAPGEASDPNPAESNGTPNV